MKNLIRTFLVVCLGLNVVPLFAQTGGRGGGFMGVRPMPQLTAAMAKLFGDNSAFTAIMESQTKMGASQESVPLNGKAAYDGGKFRFEMNTSPIVSRMTPEGAERMKAMGIDLTSTVLISRPDQKLTYTILPGMQAYFTTAMQDPDAAKPPSDFKIETTELGKETLEGHPCVKNKVVVTDDKGKQHEFTLWNATDQRGFPIKFETSDRGNTIVTLFKDIKLAKPDAALFEPPANFTRYENQSQMLQQEMMKRMGNAGRQQQ